jgi:HD-GYP domain-containing protein (c-di-GMP phosphodiesterase class II)
LLKNALLTSEEFMEIKKHPIYSYNILEPVDPFNKVLRGVLYHHENWDGSGYPEGLKGDNIPLSASIIHVADSYDAMTSQRSYRKPMSSTAAIEEIKRMSGICNCPKAVVHFCKIYGSRNVENKMA